MDRNTAPTDTDRSDSAWQKPPGGGPKRPKPLRAKEALLWVAGVGAVAALVPVVVVALSPSDEQIAATAQVEADQAFVKEVEDGVRRELRDPGSAEFRGVFTWQRTRAACGEVNGRNGFGGYSGFDHFAYHDGRIAFLGKDLKAYARLVRPCTRARYLASIKEVKDTIAVIDASAMSDADKQKSRTESGRSIAEIEDSIRNMANETLPD